jgi:hypothetical protein
MVHIPLGGRGQKRLDFDPVTFLVFFDRVGLTFQGTVNFWVVHVGFFLFVLVEKIVWVEVDFRTLASLHWRGVKVSWAALDIAVVVSLS